jgi:hypothetical protein
MVSDAACSNDPADVRNWQIQNSFADIDAKCNVAFDLMAAVRRPTNSASIEEDARTFPTLGTAHVYGKRGSSTPED